MEASGDGLLARLGLKNYSGYECSGCGALLCQECYRERQRHLVGSTPDTCPVCDSLLEHR
jgi:hypothetical protein